MNDQAEGRESRETNPIASVLIFWTGYVVLTLVIGFVTSQLIASEVWQLTTWGFVSSIGLIVLSRYAARRDKTPDAAIELPSLSAMKGLSIGLFVGAASFGLHLWIVSTFAGPVRFERVSEVGAVVTVLYLARFLATSCMEELGFRGYTIRRLATSLGTWPAVCITAVPFGLSHLLYGWDLTTIALGVIPGGLLWGMSAVATRGLAVPIGLHAAWNFAAWSVGSRAETGLLRMILESPGDGAGLVGTASYIGVFLSLTVAFWLLHRRNERHADGSGSKL